MTSSHTNPWDDDRISAYVDNALDDKDRDLFEQLLTQRPELRAAVEELKSLREQWRSLPRSKLARDISDRVISMAEQRMLLGTEQDADVTSPADPAGNRERSARRRSALWMTSAGLAAAATIAFFVWPIDGPLPRDVAKTEDQSAGKALMPQAADLPPDNSTLPMERNEDQVTPAELLHDQQSELTMLDQPSGPESASLEEATSELGVTVRKAEAAGELAQQAYPLTIVVQSPSRAQLDQLRRVLPRQEDVRRSSEERSVLSMGRVSATDRMAERVAADAEAREAAEMERDSDTATPEYEAFTVTAASARELADFLSTLALEPSQIQSLAGDEIQSPQWQQWIAPLTKQETSSSRPPITATGQPRGYRDQEGSTDSPQVTVVPLGRLTTPAPEDLLRDLRIRRDGSSAINLGVAAESATAAEITILLIVEQER